MSKPLSDEPTRKASKRTLGGKGRTLEMKEADLATMAELLCKGWPHFRIAEELCRLHGDPKYIARPTVTQDADILIRRWRKMSTGDIAEKKGEELAKIQRIEAYAWERLEALVAEGVTKTTSKALDYRPAKKKGGRPLYMSKAETKGNADTTAAWLATIRWASDQRCKILGLYAPVKVDAPGSTLNIGDGAGSVQFALHISSAKTAEELADFPVLEMEAAPALHG